MEAAARSDHVWRPPHPSERIHVDTLDVELLTGIARGEVEPLAHLYDRHAAMLLALALHIVRSRSEAEDVVHDAFLRIEARAGHYAPDRGSVTAWLVVLVRNLSIDHLRRRARFQLGVRRAADEDPGRVGTTPEDLLATATSHERVRRALATLSDSQRTTLEVAFFEGLSYPEIAQRYGVPVGTVKSRAGRALASLRVALTA